jgi:hypothetical protein
VYLPCCSEASACQFQATRDISSTTVDAKLRQRLRARERLPIAKVHQSIRVCVTVVIAVSVLGSTLDAVHSSMSTSNALNDS